MTGRIEAPALAKLDGVTLRQRNQPFEAADVTGDLWVRNREMQAPAITGRALGGRFEASIATNRLAGGNLRTVLEAAGTAQASVVSPVARRNHGGSVPTPAPLQHLAAVTLAGAKRGHSCPASQPVVREPC